MDLAIKFTKDRLSEFAAELKSMAAGIGFKVSARGWCYLLEQAGYITKNEFDKAEKLINTCRRDGLLPVDFVAEEDARAFKGISKPTDGPVRAQLQWLVSQVLHGSSYYTPDWWEGEDYYIQMLVEKIDLKTLFFPVCEQFHIPIANSKGWSSILQRAEYARRFKAAESKGLQCVLLYCGDHDPDGLLISETIRENLVQIKDVRWKDGHTGYDPKNLDIVRFGLNYDFIVANHYTWIDNLITGSGKNLASPTHRNYYMPYVQNYLSEIGPRKCEANAIVTTPQAAQSLVTNAIEDIVGPDALDRFKVKTDKVEERWEELLLEHGLTAPMIKCLDHEIDEDEEF